MFFFSFLNFRSWKRSNETSTTSIHLFNSQKNNHAEIKGERRNRAERTKSNWRKKNTKRKDKTRRRTWRDNAGKRNEREIKKRNITYGLSTLNSRLKTVLRTVFRPSLNSLNKLILLRYQVIILREEKYKTRMIIFVARKKCTGKIPKDRVQFQKKMFSQSAKFPSIFICSWIRAFATFIYLL